MSSSCVQSLGLSSHRETPELKCDKNVIKPLRTPRSCSGMGTELEMGMWGGCVEETPGWAQLHLWGQRMKPEEPRAWHCWHRERWEQGMDSLIP